MLFQHLKAAEASAWHEAAAIREADMLDGAVRQGVDIFSKDFLFLPIHDHLHWSLVIICHAAASAEDGQTCTPWILHLDSMSCVYLSGRCDAGSSPASVTLLA